eukprot:1394023-Amorphochlora_amoeboformis.AAC.1
MIPGIRATRKGNLQPQSSSSSSVKTAVVSIGQIRECEQMWNLPDLNIAEKNEARRKPAPPDMESQADECVCVRERKIT